MRNREVGLYALLCALAVCAGVAAGFLAGGAGGALACLGLGLVLTGLGLAFTRWRYGEIKKLSAALMRAAADGQVLDARTSREGELSILQNDLYKITAALAGQADHLRQDKVFLAGALSDISHQLKTPLTSLLVLSDLLQDEDLPPDKRREFLQRTSAQLERLRWLVASLLRLSRVDAAVVPFKREGIALHALLSGAAEPMLAMAEQRDVALTIDCAQGLTWQGDPEWTREALGNLIKNCVEHAPPGGAVQVYCVNNPLHTQVVVEDDGPGFSSEDLPRLFERFYRGANAGGEGVGIGLALAKSILQAQGADVTAENAPAGGARFIVRLHQREGAA